MHLYTNTHLYTYTYLLNYQMRKELKITRSNIMVLSLQLSDHTDIRAKCIHFLFLFLHDSGLRISGESPRTL